MRSKLFVSGARPELFAKALATAADAVAIDLEDSVPESGKRQARSAVAAFLKSSEARKATQLIIVRTNALGTEHFEADLMELAQPGLTMINLPKPESAADILAAVAMLEDVEASNKLSRPIELLANVETPAALRRAVEIATAHPRVVGLQLGLGDLFEPLAMDRRDGANVHAAMFAVRMAAAEAGVFAIDGAFADVQDQEGYRREAEMARGLGYIGKSCIHPSQVDLANQVFEASATEIAVARRVVEASREAKARGHGAFLADGRMIDAPFLKRAEAIVAAAGFADDEPD
ncbi:MAG: HpcH/HpaI aldolase/citrate lyase family protein [Burkholderiaceae bacterium]